MALEIVAAKNIKQAREVCSIYYRGDPSQRTIVEIEEIADFLYEHRDELLHYEAYYTFDPYRVTYLKKDRVNEVKIFANSILRWLEENNIEENEFISKYNCTLKNIGDYAIQLNTICDYAMENGYGLVGLGD